MHAILVYDDWFGKGTASTFDLVQRMFANVLRGQLRNYLVRNGYLSFTVGLRSSPNRTLRHDKIACLATSILVFLLTSYGVLNLFYSSCRFFWGDKCDLILIELRTRRHIGFIRPLAEVLSRGHLAKLRLSSVTGNRSARWPQISGSLLLVKSLRLIILLPGIFGWAFKMTYWWLWNVIISGVWFRSYWWIIVADVPLL